MSDERWRFRIWQDGMIVAAGDAPDKRRMLREMSHYAMMYGQDGPIERIETRTGKNKWRRHVS